MEMMYFKTGVKHSLLTMFAVLMTLFSFGQNRGPAVEQWRSFLPYNQVVATAVDNKGDVIFAATEYGFFTYNRKDGSLEAYSKVSGMHDIGMTSVAFDRKTQSALLAYQNGNIDIFKNNTFYNVPDLKISQISGNKTIYAVTTINGTGLLSTGIGLVMVNLTKNEINYTIPFYQGSLFATVHESVVDGSKIYVATSVGLFRTDISNKFIQDYTSWEKLSNAEFTKLVMSENKLYAAQNNTVFVLGQDTIRPFFSAAQKVVHLDESAVGVWVSAHNEDEGGVIYLLNEQAQKTDSILTHSPTSVLELPGAELWYSDNSNYAFAGSFGLRKRISKTETESYTPDGPISASAFDISAYNGEIWVAHGGHNASWAANRDRSMFSVYKENRWKNFSWLSDNGWVQDFIRILFYPQTNRAYAGSLTGGLVEVAPDQSFQVYNENKLPEMTGFGNEGLYNVSGMTIDPSGNLWISSNGAGRELTLKTAKGDWFPMQAIAGNTQGGTAHSAADVVMDDYGQLWMITTNGSGVLVYDPNGTPEDRTDDRYRVLGAGVGNGNLPDNKVTGIAKAKNGSIWISSNNGIGIIHCPGDVISRNCETSLTPVKFDEFADDYLFVRQAVAAIAVDEAGRTWVGSGNGLWLLNTEGEDVKTIYRFTTDNSPLPSNQVQRINIDPVTGDVYFSTDKGFVAFRSTATKRTTTAKSDILVYPNPVPSGYSGQIAVRGLPEGADVRFTDIAGKLVYKTSAYGAQAVWNGKDYTGRKVQSGVYLVFVVSKDGSEKMATKIMVQK